MNEEKIVCPNCKFEVKAERYGFGECPNCKEMKWNWTSNFNVMSGFNPFIDEEWEEEVEYYEWSEIE